MKSKLKIIVPVLLLALGGAYKFVSVDNINE